MDAILSNIQLAIRSLARSRTFTTVALVSLALGIGANVTVFTLVNAIAFKPLPYPDSDALVDLHEWSATKLCAGCGVGTSAATFQDWRANARSFTAMAAYLEQPFDLSGVEVAERVGGAIVSAETFSALGVRPLLGRDFAKDDDRLGAAPVVLLSHGLWTRRYAADRRIVGQTIRVNGVPHTVIGVMPPRFKFPEFAEVWVPFTPNAAAASRDQRDYGVVARLAPGATLANADAEMMTIARALAQQYPETQKEWTAHATRLRTEFAGVERSLYLVLLGAVGFVLLIVCANLAGLLLARGAQRQKEIAIRIALGASRGQIVRFLLTEALLLSFAGGAAGMLVASWGVDLSVRSFGAQVPGWLDFSIDMRVVAFLVAVSIVAGLLFGLLPAVRVSTPDVHAVLKEGSLTVRRSRARGLLVVGELAVALVLLAGAGVLMKSFLTISAGPSGADERDLLTGKIEFLDAKYREPAAIRVTADQILERVRRLPGTSDAAIDRTEFIAGFGGRDETIRVEGMARVPENASPRFYHVVTPGYFNTVRVPLVAGRYLGETDRAGSELVAMIGKQTADRLWPDGTALGKRIKLGPGDSLPWMTIVGVVGDVTERGRHRDYAYVPFAQQPGRPATLLVRAVGEPLRLLAPVRAAVRAVDPDLPIIELQTVEQQRHSSFSPYRVYALSMASFAAFAIVLAAVGLYGVIAYNTAQRTKEIGVRMALGAEARHVIALVAAQGGRLVVLGIVLGLLGSMTLLRVIRGMLFGASPIDPPIFAAVSVLLAAVALIAVWIPARRAARIDPLEALRAE